MKIQVLHNRECGFWKVAWRELEALAQERYPDAALEEVVVVSDDEARRWRFFGSPQVSINGKDIDPMAERVSAFHASGCRPYFWKGAQFDYPPQEMLEEALRRVADGA